LKLGLALSGGGFRASLFHIGAMARLAELDLLGKVEVLSTVSGGSIVGAMYYLMLKDLLETPAAPPPAPSAPAPLSAADFVALIRRLEEDFLAGVQRNPRMRVLTNPLENIRMALTDYSRTDRMAGLYNRYFYRAVWERCTGQAV
jgi:NTE family protein